MSGGEALSELQALLNLTSTKEKENKRLGEEIIELLSKPSTKEKALAASFKSQGGTVVKEFCPHGTKRECRRVSALNRPCGRVHFRRIIQKHTDESLGDCSFLNTCFHMETCKYVHYEVDNENPIAISPLKGGTSSSSHVSLPDSDNIDPSSKSVTILHPAQWIHCDLRFFDMTILGKFSVIMADPPWDIHMELPYGTLSDDEMRRLNIPALQDEGLIFLWVTGRASTFVFFREYII
jgi:mRNA (2'-O-methyladenosine-N6-)-methyltransferase